MYASDPNYGIIISSSNAAIFFGSYSTNVVSGPSHIVPILTGNLGTTPGATYEISYTVANDPVHAELGSGNLSFGSSNYKIDLFAIGGPGSTQDFHFQITTTSPSTTMAFTWWIDNGYQASVSGLSITQVPEVSSARLSGLGGCILLLAQRWRRLSQRRQAG